MLELRYEYLGTTRKLIIPRAELNRSNMNTFFKEQRECLSQRFSLKYSISDQLYCFNQKECERDKSSFNESFGFPCPIFMKTEAIYSDETKQHKILLRKEWGNGKKAMILMTSAPSAGMVIMDYTTPFVINNLSRLGYERCDILKHTV